MSELLQYKCPSCGAPVEFDSGVQKMKCPYCSTEYELDALKAYGEVLETESESSLDWKDETTQDWRPGELDGLRVYTCKSCGGEVVADESTGATACPWCQSPVVMSGQFSGDLRPDFVIPFKLSREQAKAALKEHINSKRFVPAVFRRDSHLEEIKGVYVPYWLYDTDANASIRYRATKVRVWSDARNNYRDTSYYLVTREGSLGFTSVPVDGTSKIANDMTESIEPYDLSEAVDFQTAYLSGFLADRYDVSRETCEKRADERIQNSTEAAFARTVQGYATVTPEHTGIQLQNGRTRYGLMPVWLLTTSWNGTLYHFAMNGQTGKFVGNIPADKKAYWKSFALRAGLIAAAAYAVLTLITLL